MKDKTECPICGNTCGFAVGTCIVADMRLSDKYYNGSRQCFVNHKARLSTMVYLFSYMFDCEIKTEMRDRLYTFVSVDGEIREMDGYTEKEEI